MTAGIFDEVTLAGGISIPLDDGFMIDYEQGNINGKLRRASKPTILSSSHTASKVWNEAHASTALRLLFYHMEILLQCQKYKNGAASMVHPRMHSFSPISSFPTPHYINHSGIGYRLGTGHGEIDESRDSIISFCSHAFETSIFDTHFKSDLGFQLLF